MSSDRHAGNRISALTAFTSFAMVLTLISGFLLPVRAHAQDTDTNPDATLRILHASPGSPAVDVLIDGQPFSQNLAFGTATDYAPLAEGKYKLQIVPTGQPADNAVVDKEIDLDSGKAYILAIKNPLKDIDTDLIEVDLDAVSPDKARIRAIQLSPDAGKVDFAVTGGDVLFNDLDNGDKSDYEEVDPGTYSFDLRADDDRVLFTASDVQLNNGTTYDVFIIGQIADSTLAIVPLATSVSTPCTTALGLQGDVTDACVRVVHASPGSPAVDVYLNGSPAVQNLAFGTATDYVAVPSSDKVKVQIAPTGSDLDNAVVDKEFDLDAGQAYEFVATGELNDIEATEATVDLTPLPEGQARVRVIQASPDSDSVDVAIKGNDDNLFSDVNFRDASDYQVLEAGDLTFEVKKHDESDVLVEATTTLTAGNTYDLIVAGRSSDQSLQVIALESTAAVRQGGIATPAAAGTPEVANTVVSQATSETDATESSTTQTQEAGVPTPTPAS